MTKEQRNKYLAQWRERNRTRIREQHSKWYEKNKSNHSLKAKRSEQYRDWANRNKGHLLETGRLYRLNNRDKVAANKKSWYISNPEKVRMMRKREMLNPNVRLATGIRSRLRLALLAQGARRSSKTVVLLGCTIPESRKYLESKFKPGMTWQNYGDWHIDHIVPLSKFNLSSNQEQRIACHFTNLQPLWAKENLTKSTKSQGDWIIYVTTVA